MLNRDYQHPNQITSTSSKSTTSKSGEAMVSGNIPEKVKTIEDWLKYLFAGIILAIILLSIDLYRDSNLHTRITELEREIAIYKKEIVGQQVRVNNLLNVKTSGIEEDINQIQGILNCFEQKKYWKYEECFK